MGICPMVLGTGWTMTGRQRNGKLMMTISELWHPRKIRVSDFLVHVTAWQGHNWISRSLCLAAAMMEQCNASRILHVLHRQHISAVERNWRANPDVFTYSASTN